MVREDKSVIESRSAGREPARAGDWSVGVRLWVESEGRPLLGPGRLELLEAVERCHSISAAARQVGMSYRRAWLLIDGMNQAAGTELVTTRTGGRQGGGASLTDRGRFAVTVFRGLLEHVRRVAEGSLAWLTGPDDGTVHVACATSLEGVLRQLLVDFAALDPSARVRAVTGASDELSGHLFAGAPADLFLTADPGQLDRLSDAGLIAPGSEVTLARNGLAAVGVRGGPAVHSPAELAGPAVRHVALADPGCPLGAYTRAYLEPLGLWEAVRSRAIFLDNPSVVLAAVRAGRAEAGLVYRSDGATAAGCRVLFRASPASVRCAAALTRRGADRPVARALLTFLTSPAAGRRFRRCGFLPGGDDSGRVISE
jgi:molybdate transport system substrate-binding protein